MSNHTKALNTILKNNSANPEYYHYIQNPIECTIKLIYEGYKYYRRHNKNNNPVYILDVGAGTGGTALLIKGLIEGWNLNKNKGEERSVVVMGIEIDENLIPIADRQKVLVHKQNALTYNCYKNFNIIYYYHPIKNKELMRELEQTIANNAKPGTVIISALRCPDATSENAYFDGKFFMPKGLKLIYQNKLYKSAIYVKL